MLFMFSHTVQAHHSWLNLIIHRASLVIGVSRRNMPTPRKQSVHRQYSSETYRTILESVAECGFQQGIARRDSRKQVFNNVAGAQIIRVIL